MDPFWNVTYNLFAIYEATRHPVDPSSTAKEDERCYENLQPNLTFLNGNRNLNFSARGVMHSLLHSSLYKKETLARNQAVADYTHRLFHQYQRQLMLSHLPEHEKMLIQKINHQPVDKMLCKKTQDNIQEVYDGSQYWFKEVQAGQNKRMNAIFQEHFCQQCFDHMAQLEENYAIIALEGVIDDELPLKALINASFGINEDYSATKKFAHALAASKIDIRILHSALKGIIAHAKRFHQTEAHAFLHQVPDLAALESLLYDQNPQIFKQIDPDHLAWRKALHEDAALTSAFYNEKTGKLSRYEIVLGKQLGKKEASDDFDHNLYFEIKTISLDGDEQPEIPHAWVLWVSINTALPGIKWKQAETCLIKPAEFHFIDNQGRFALVDRLQPLPSGSLANNETFYKFISGWLGWMACEAKITLDNLNVDNYMLARHPEELNRVVITAIKSTRPLERYSYAKLEQFAYDISRGDNTVYQYIMNQSGLSQTDEAVYIKSAILAAFQEKFDLEKVALRKKFKDKSVIDLAIKLQLDVVKMCDNCMKILKMKHHAPSNTELEKLILEKYTGKGCVSLLWPTLEQEIVDHFS